MYVSTRAAAAVNVPDVCAYREAQRKFPTLVVDDDLFCDYEENKLSIESHRDSESRL